MVEALESCFVVPSHETPKGRLWLSNLDQVALREYVGTVYFYKKTEATDFFSVEVMKAALSKALVLFYPLAGRYVARSDGRVEIDCNAEGCFFVKAQMGRTLDSIKLWPSRELEDFVVPSIKMAKSPFVMLIIQVTYLKCGGVVVGFAFNHVLGDARGSFHFIRTWADITRGNLSKIVAPSFDQTSLRARSPPIVKYDHPEYVRKTTKPTLAAAGSSTTAKFRLSKEQVSSLKIRCNRGTNVTKISAFCAVASLVWTCYCNAQGLLPDSIAYLVFMVDIRNRLKPPLPKHHFGNAIVRRYLQSKVSNITSNSLHIVAESVKTAVDSVNNELIRSLIDYIEIERNEVVLRREMPESHLLVNSISGMPVYDANFGWGDPQLASRWSLIGKGFVFISDEPGGNGSIEVVLTLDSATMNRFEKLFDEELKAESSSSVGMDIHGQKNHIGQCKL